MNCRPILFNSEMVRAILEGRKTQTRRVIKSQPNYHLCHGQAHKDLESNILRRCSYGKKSDYLWVRETWAANIIFDAFLPRDIPENLILDYFADGDEGKLKLRGRRRSSRFMCKWMSRITLKITDIIVERVQDISQNDIKAEGCPFGFPDDIASCHTNTELFIGLWDSINEKRGYGWDINPWVFVVKFERIK